MRNPGTKAGEIGWPGTWEISFLSCSPGARNNTVYSRGHSSRLNHISGGLGHQLQFKLQTSSIWGSLEGLWAARGSSETNDYRVMVRRRDLGHTVSLSEMVLNKYSPSSGVNLDAYMYFFLKIPTTKPALLWYQNQIRKANYRPIYLMNI